VMKPSPGILSVVIQSEMACSRGARPYRLHRTRPAFVLEDMVDEATSPYKLGTSMAMNLDILRLSKDGFYSSPAGTFAC
jgi:hypothetical protein